MSKGYMFVGFGEPYVTEVINLVHTLRHTGDTLPVAVLCGPDDAKLYEVSNLFHRILIMDFSIDLYNEPGLTSFERYGVIHTLFFNQLVPFDETIITDSDVLCQYNPKNVWEIMSRVDQCVNLTGQKYDPMWNFGRNQYISDKLGKNVPAVHTGILYINKNHRDIDKFFSLLPHIYKNYDEYGLLRLFRNSRADEPIYAVAFALMDYLPIEGREHPIMTFNLPESADIPSKIQTLGIDAEPIYMDRPLPFVHVFKQYRNRYNTLAKKIMNTDSKLLQD